MPTLHEHLAAIARMPQNVRFRILERVVVGFGFELKRIRGSHHIDRRPGVAEPINLQNVRGQAKPYQVRQFLALVERYELELP